MEQGNNLKRTGLKRCSSQAAKKKTDRTVLNGGGKGLFDALRYVWGGERCSEGVLKINKIKRFRFSPGKRGRRQKKTIRKAK